MECQRVMEQQYHHHQHAVSSLGVLQTAAAAATEGKELVRAGGGGGGGGGSSECQAVQVRAEECTVLDVEMAVPEGCRAACRPAAGHPHHSRKQEEGEQGERLASEAAEPGGDTAQLPFSRELITFSLFGKMPAKFSKSCGDPYS